MLDISDEEPGALEQLQPAAQATGHNQSPSVQINMSRHIYRKLKQFAFWKIRKVPQAGHSKSMQACEEVSSASEEVNSRPTGLAPLRLEEPWKTQRAATAHLRSEDSSVRNEDHCHKGNPSGNCTRAILRVAESNSSHPVHLAALSPQRPPGAPLLPISPRFLEQTRVNGPRSTASPSYVLGP